jgi:hypothetical protein
MTSNTHTSLTYNSRDEQLSLSINQSHIHQHIYPISKTENNHKINKQVTSQPKKTTPARRPNKSHSTINNSSINTTQSYREIQTHLNPLQLSTISHNILPQFHPNSSLCFSRSTHPLDSALSTVSGKKILQYSSLPPSATVAICYHNTDIIISSRQYNDLL